MFWGVHTYNFVSSFLPPSEIESVKVTAGWKEMIKVLQLYKSLLSP